MKGHVIQLWLWFFVAAFTSQAWGETQHHLTEKDAERRAKQVENIKYDLAVDLDGENKTFKGEITISFAAKKPQQPLRLDFYRGTIHAMLVNGKKVAKPDYNNYFVTIPGKLLRRGTNNINISYSHPYSTDGSGFYRFQDPEDHKVYLYTNFEPFDANKFFPCFDQPDLKATYALQVKAPKDWQVISAEREKKVEEGGAFKTWVFPESLKFSTYLFALHAGPYKVWEEKYRIPLRLFARQSMAQYIDTTWWFNTTKKGFDFFEDYFAEPYPFKKYDQVVVADFNSGAMENVAAVTFSERYFPRGPWTKDLRKSLDNTVLHEMAHMWFGNLVTMRWWDDLWLNESFATYMSAKAMDKALDEDATWRDFYSGTKSWAYWTDELVTTHPIQGKVPNTETAMAQFDGITYGKGASFLKQLDFYLEDNNFRDGVRLYFDTYKYSNTVLRDFIASLEKASKKDLREYTKLWLTKPGMNRLQAEVACKGQKVTSLKLLQKPDRRFKELRQHRAEVAFLSLDNDGVLSVEDAFAVTYSKATTPVPEAVGKKCPMLVYPNYRDHDYVKVELDEKTLATADASLALIKDPFLRMKFWKAYWDDVRDGRYPVQKFSELVLRELEKEQDYEVAKHVLRFTEYGLLEYLWAVQDFKPKDIDRVAAQYSHVFKQRLESAKPGSDFQKLWFDQYVEVARDQGAVSIFRDLLKGSRKIDGLEIDQDRRWSLIFRLSSLNAPDARELREEEFKKDGSHSGQKMKLVAEAAVPDHKVKEKFMREIFDTKSSLSPAMKRAVAHDLFYREQMAMKKAVAQIYYEKLPELVRYKDANIAIKVAGPLAPVYCSRESVRALDKFLGKQKGLPFTITKNLRIAKQEDERCLRIKEVASSYAAKKQG